MVQAQEHTHNTHKHHDKKEAKIYTRSTHKHKHTVAYPKPRMISMKEVSCCIIADSAGSNFYIINDK